MSETKTLVLHVDVVASPTNEIEDDVWFDPEDVAEYLQSEKVLLGYNSHAGQHITSVRLWKYDS